MESNQSAGALNVAVTTALEAGKYIAQQIDRLDRVKVNQKSALEWVSEVDVRAEEIIIDALLNAFPSVNILSEERGLIDNQSDSCWVIDPLDGTHNYVHGHPHCAVAIALTYREQTQVAVAFDPLRNELFSASKGRGAQLDNRRIRASEASRLSESLVATGFPHGASAHTRAWLKSFAAVLPRAQGVHRTGASVLDLAYVAAGRYDGCWSYGLKPWDVVGGELMIKEAGGLISNLPPTPGEATRNVVAAAPKLYETLRKLVI